MLVYKSCLNVIILVANAWLISDMPATAIYRATFCTVTAEAITCKCNTITT